MRPTSGALLGVVLLTMTAACGGRNDRRNAPRAASNVARTPPAVPTRAESSGPCGFASPVRVTQDSIGPFPVTLLASELQQHCGFAAHLDGVGVGGDVVPALRVIVGSDTIWAAQDDNSELVPDEPITLWHIVGRDIVLRDGHTAPTTVGELRVIDSTAVLVADRGDDSDGVYVLRCAEPRLTYDLGEAPTPDESGAWPLASHPTLDSVAITRLEIIGRLTPSLASRCPQAQSN